jgi:hypothetical protein
MDAVCVLGAPDIICVQRASFLPVADSLDPGCPGGTGGHRGRRGSLVERILLGTRCIAQGGKTVVEIERGISHERGGGIRLPAERALQLIASGAEHAGDSGEGKLLLGGGYLADLRRSGTAGCIGNPGARYAFIPAKWAAFTLYWGRAVGAEERCGLAASARDTVRTCGTTADRLRLSKINAAKNRVTEQKGERAPAEYSRQLHTAPPTSKTKLHNANFQIHAVVSAFPAWVTYVQKLRLNFVLIEAKSCQI